MGGIIEANREPVQYRAGEGRRKRKGEEGGGKGIGNEG